MEQSYFKGIISKLCIKRIVLCGIGTLGIIIFGLLNMTYLKSVLIKPIEISGEVYDEAYFINSEILSPLSISKDLEFENTWYYETVREENSSIEKKTSSVYITSMGEKLVFGIYASSAAEDPEVLDAQGKVFYVKDTSEVTKYDQLLTGVISEYSSYGYEFVEEDFAPKVLYIVNERAIHDQRNMIYAVAVVVGLLIIGIIVNILNITNFKKSKSITALKAYGEVDDVLLDIENDTVLYRSKSGIVTRKWFIGTLSRLKFVKIDELMWIYLYTRKNNGITTYALELRLKNGKAVSYSIANEDVAREIMNQLNDLVPWIYFGYSEDFKKMWKNNREAMLQDIESNRRIMSLQA